MIHLSAFFLDGSHFCPAWSFWWFAFSILIWCLGRVEGTVGVYLLASFMAEGASQLQGDRNTS